MFDYKPELAKLEGKPIPPSVIGGQRYAFIRPDANVLGPDGEVFSMRTATSRTFKNADGTLRTEITAGAVNYKDSGGAWQKIDPTLIAGPANAAYMRNAAGPVQVQLPDDLGTSPVVVTTPGGTAASVSPTA